MMGALVVAMAAMPASAGSVKLTPLSTYSTGLFDESAAEIPAYDPVSQRLFVTNATQGVDILDLSDPTNLSLISTIAAPGINSVAFNNGLLALAVEASPKQNNGTVDFYDAFGASLGSVNVGALPDMLTFSPDGNKILVANEGEPNDAYTNDPNGSVSVIDISGGVASATVQNAVFTAFNGQEAALRNEGVRIFGPGASAAQDFEPEYIGVSSDSKTAYVALQENNAIAVVDVDTATVTDVLALGFKDHSQPGNELDPSNKDGGINIDNWPVFGMYQPDAIAVVEANGETYIVTANEGDARDYDGFSEEFRIKNLDPADGDYIGRQLDPTAFPNANDLLKDENLGRLRFTDQLGDTDGDGDFDELYVYGGRSISVFRVNGSNLDLVFDTGDELEQIIAARLPDDFNSSNDANQDFDGRSDDKGPEPEGLTIGTFMGKTYVFVGLERIGGVMVYDITDPTDPEFVDYVNNRDFSVVLLDSDENLIPGALDLVGDLGPEGLLYINALDSPTGQELLVVTNEVSGTTTIYSVAVPTPSAVGAGLLVLSGLVLRRRR